jgi:hypothetical protein
VRIEFFGDSYDVVKRFLLQSLAPSITWDAFPMFTHAVTAPERAAFEAFLGVRIASPGILESKVDRAEHLFVMPQHRYVFLDPDTGIKLKPCSGKTSTKYVFGPELADICLGDPHRLALVFDQSVSRGSERQSMDDKLAYFEERGVHSFAYLSHACFVVLSASNPSLDTALTRLRETGLPTTRILCSRA